MALGRNVLPADPGDLSQQPRSNAVLFWGWTQRAEGMLSPSSKACRAWGDMHNMKRDVPWLSVKPMVLWAALHARSYHVFIHSCSHVFIHARPHHVFISAHSHHLPMCSLCLHRYSFSPYLYTCSSSPHFPVVHCLHMCFILTLSSYIVLLIMPLCTFILTTISYTFFFTVFSYVFIFTMSSYVFTVFIHVLTISLYFS